jgi:hypothetical protein
MPPKALSGAAKRKKEHQLQCNILKTNQKINYFFESSQYNNGKYKIIL